MKLYAALLLIFAAFFEIIGDFFLKKWSIEDKGFLFAIGLTAFACSSVFWAFTLKFHDISKATVVFNTISTVLVVLMGVFLFQEELSLVNKIGIFLSILGLFLIEA